MVIDTSAVLAILLNEPERRGFNEAVEAAESIGLSAAFVETSIVVEARFGSDGLRGLMTTKDGAVINLVGSGVGSAVGDGFEYRGAIYFHTSAEKYSHLNTIAGVMEYGVDGDGNTVTKVWEWK